MSQPLFIRNARAGSLFEFFFVASVSSVLLIRVFLEATGYPQIGGDSLHIAHVLYGGILMLAALILCFSSLGHRTMSIAALLGGAGFGFFIDELGKFVTKDNNYFFRPTSVLIYIFFVLLFFVFRKVSRQQIYTPLEYTINSIALLEEVILKDLDGAEHSRLQYFLNQSDPKDPIVAQLRGVVSAIPKSSLVESHRLDKLRQQLGQLTVSLLSQRKIQDLVSTIFIGQAVLSIATLSISVFGDYNFGGNTLSAISLPQAGQLISAYISFILLIIGGFHLRRSRLTGLEFFRRAILVDLLVTQPFIFYSAQFSAAFGLAFKLALWGIILYLITAERRETLHANR